MARLRSLTVVNRRRLFWSVWIAIGVHALILFGVHFTLPANPPDALVFSLQVDLVQQQGGNPESITGGPPPQPQRPERPLDPPLVSESLLATRAEDQTAPEPVETPPVSPLAAAAEIDLHDADQAPITSRSRRLQPDERATPAGQYGERWRRLMEHLGVLNFPEEARQRRLSGRLTLDVAIRADGSLHSIQLLESSGHPLLDEAARRTVLSAAPFEPFPEALRRDYDVLHILRSWEFDVGDTSGSRN